MKLNMLLTAAFVVSTAYSVHAQDQHAGHGDTLPGHPATAKTTRPIAGPHGGSLKQTGDVQLETVVSQGGIQMYVYDRNDQPVAVDRGRGSASIRVEGNAKRYRYDLLPDGKGGLTAPVNLSQSAGRQIEVKIQLVGIAATGGQTILLNEIATVPASEMQLAAAAIARQKSCPVSGKSLGSMGDPVAVDVSGQRVFVCCAGCIKKVQAEPGKYLAMVSTVRTGNTVSAGTEQVRAGIFKVAAEDAPFIAAQKKCPVMDEPLGAMGGPYKVNAAGKAIYICCPGCAKRVAGEPQKWLAVLESQGVQAPTLR